MKAKKRIIDNIVLRILSVIIAILLWLVVANIEDPVITKQFNDVPVEVVNAEVLDSINKVYEIVEGETANFTVKGRSSVLSDLTADDFNVLADFSHLSDVNSVNVDISAKSSATQVEIYKNSNTVVVSLEDEDSANFPITVVTSGEVEDGYAIGEKTATPNILEVTGPASMIKKIDTVQALIDVNNAYDDVSGEVEIKYLNGDGDELDATRFTAKTSTVSVKVQVLKTKEVDVNVSTIGELAAGYSIKNVNYEPQKIKIAGPDEVLSEVEEIVIDDVDVTGLSKDAEFSISPLEYLPEGTYLANAEEQIMVTVEVGRYITKSITITKDDIDISGGNPSYNYNISDDTTIKLTISGYADELNGLKASDFKPMIDVTDCGVGSYLLALQYENPEDIETVVSGKVSVNIAKTSD
ncbi:MAG: hypothetical protein K5656_11945 [Lachnospiraceae bacterium]|nr:hypothetical protein [Lachnospiraceae bacterium]